VCVCGIGNASEFLLNGSLNDVNVALLLALFLGKDEGIRQKFYPKNVPSLIVIAPSSFSSSAIVIAPGSAITIKIKCPTLPFIKHLSPAIAWCISQFYDSLYLIPQNSRT